MRMKTSLFKRSLAALLCFVMLLGMFPALGFAPVALADETDGTTGDDTTGDGTTDGEDNDTGLENPGQQTNITGDYITLPITIRDFAADGMLFEYNENYRNNLSGTATTYTKTDRLYSYTSAAYTAAYNPDYWDHNSTNGTLTANDGYDFTGLRVYEADYGVYSSLDSSETNGAYWYCVILDASGNVLKVLDLEAAKEDVDTVIANTEGAAYSVWAWRNPKNVPYYSLLAQITEDNKHLYRFGFDMTTEVNSYNYNGVCNLYLGRSFYQDIAPYTKDSKGIYVYAGNGLGWLGNLDAYDAWHCVIINASTGKVVEVIPNGTDKVAESANYLTADYKFVMAWSDGINKDYHDYIAAITDTNKSEYAIAIQTTGLGGPALFVERTITVNEADTKGFGLLMTNANDYYHNLYDDGDDDWTDGDAGTIAGSELISHNSQSTTTDANGNTVTKGILEAGLWDSDGVQYATQDVIGATIRTNLVTKELDKQTGKPVYTRGTVDYLADYLSVLMAIPEKDSNGYYNTHHVMGTKLYDADKTYVGPNNPLAVYDMADIFRMNVTGGLGDYDIAKTKFDNRQLLYPHQATTWYEAAYYLLHMLWDDSPVDERTGTEGQDGYGMPITNYNRIHLVKTTNENGDECYVFNAKYDGTTYDYWNGEIFNSHFGSYNTETRPYSYAYQKDGDTLSSQGNILPAARFDPLGPSGAGVNRGYTMSGDTYGDFMKNNSMDWAEYYDETNYHMSLEGHAQFVYHEDANQYFTFTGDDDVYLYINDVRVLDVGGAHSIAKVSIDLNDVAAEIGLSDGGTYRFDFFFLERHGTAANFGIETNIQIADASMNTAKTGYQGGTNTGYGGPVNKDTHVGYSFELHNQGTAHIYNLTFQDDQIGVYFGYDRLQYYPTTYPADYPEDKKGEKLYTIKDLYLIYWDKTGKMTEFIAAGSLTEDSLKKHLDDGLDPGEKIGIYGFKYYIPESQWVQGNDEVYFNNHVYTSANTDPEGNGTPLHGVSDWKVVQMEVPYTPFHVYDWVHKAVPKATETKTDTPWVGQSVTVDWTKLKEYLKDEIEAGKITQEQLNNAKVVRCTGSGNEQEHNQNPNVKVSTDGRSITYTSSTTGKDTVFFKFKNIAEKYNDLVFSYEVYTYGVGDNVYVLDYGLAVELAGQNFGFQNNDVLTNNFNNYPVRVTATVVNPTSNYGDFTHTSAVDASGNTSISSLKYTPDAIINNTDSVQVKIKIVETQTEGETTTEKTLDKYTGVEMIQEITTAPASVVYYEENFPGITYASGAWGNWVQYETMVPKTDENGNVLKDTAGNIIYESVAGIEQSADQDSNYGSDPNYDKDKDGVLIGKGQIGTDEDKLSASLEIEDLDKMTEDAIKEMNDYLAIRGGDSNGTVKELEILSTADEVMHFTFIGTGVEIIGRTTDDAYAVINVMVQKVNRDAEGNITDYTNYRQKPVITQSIGGDQYQVPIISFTGLDKAEYRVVLKVMKSAQTTVRRMLYIDGVRIYGPLGDDEALEYYNPEEYKAQFLEVKQLIKEGKVIFCAATDTQNKFQSVTGDTLVENENDNSVLKSITSTIEYLQIGPNNELYMRGGSKTAVIAFFLTEIPDYMDGARTLQIGAHRKADSDKLDNTSAVNMVYGSMDTKLINAKAGDANFYSVDTGTEMYYDIDFTQLTYDETLKGWIVMIGTNGATNPTAKDTLALTNIKVAGYEISSVSEALKNAVTPTSLPIVTQPLSVLKGWIAAANQAPEIEELPVNENLRIEAVDFTEDTVASGWYAMMTIRATSDAESVVVYDADGNKVELASCDRRTKKGVVYFDVAFIVTGNRGEKQTYTIRVLDTEKMASVNTETITVTIV